MISLSRKKHDIVATKDKMTEVWRIKEKTGSETCSVSETEEQGDSVMKTVGLELEKMPKAETSYTKNEIGPQDISTKPILMNKQATVTLCSENKGQVKDKGSGPGLYGLREPITLKNKFQLFDSNVETKT